MCLLFISVPPAPPRQAGAAPCFRAYFLLPLDRTLLYPLYLCCAKCYSPFFLFVLVPAPGWSSPIPTYIHIYIHATNPTLGPAARSPCSIPPLSIVSLSSSSSCLRSLPPYLPTTHFFTHLYIAVCPACLLPKERPVTTPAPLRTPNYPVLPPPALPTLYVRARTALLFLCYFFLLPSLPAHIARPSSVTIMSFLFHLNSIMVLFCSSIGVSARAFVVLRDSYR